MAVTTSADSIDQHNLVENFSASQFLQSAFSSRVNEIIAHVGALRENISTDAIHDCRVAIRTTRSYLKTFSPLLKWKVTQDLDDELRWLGKHVGRLRDVDVEIALVHRLSQESKQDFQLVLHELERHRQECTVNLALVLKRKRVDALLTQLVHFSLQPTLRKKVLAKSSSECKALITQCVSQTWVSLFGAINVLPKKPKLSALHKVRLMAKQCRYAYEAAELLNTFPTDHIAEQAKKLQQLLGNINDKATLKRWVEKQDTFDTATTEALVKALNLSKRVNKKKLFG